MPTPMRGARVERTASDDLVREWTLAADVQAIGPVVQMVQRMCEAAGFSARQCALQVPVALTEALANAIQCGASDASVQLRVEIAADTLHIAVHDSGTGFDLDRCTEGPGSANWLDREDGRGVFLMRALMDHVESVVVPQQDGHTLRLQLRRS